MILCYFLKLLTECSLYFVAANCIMSVAFTKIDSLVPAILCALAGTLSYWLHEKNRNRYLSLPLLAAALLFAKGVGTAIALFLPVFYIFMVIKEKHFFLDSEQQSTLFRWGLAGSFICYFLFGIFIGVQWVVPFILLFLFANVLLMRLLRQNPANLNNKRYLLNNALQLGGALAVTALLTTDFVLGLLKSIWSWIYDTLIEPVAWWISVGLTYIGSWMNYFFQSIFNEYQHREQHNQFRPGDFHDEAFYAQIEDAMGQESPAVIVLQICLLVIGICVILAIIRWRRRGQNLHRQSAVKETRHAVTEHKQEEKVPVDLIPPKDPRLAVRFYYRKFLHLCRKLEYQFPDSFTSEKIADSVSRQLGKEPVKNIRQTYIRARYSSKDISPKDVAAMKEQVSKLREQYEPKKKED